MTWSQGSKVDAPCINEFPLTVECRLVHTAELGLHTRFIGEIMEVWAAQDVLDDQGRPDMVRIEPLLYNPGTRIYAKSGDAVGPAFSIGRKLI
jgi:flavin reductase (DIM6/NTAB) family NADH-FMN oxidoreductase RutF